jgi:hypothetical protein
MQWLCVSGKQELIVFGRDVGVSSGVGRDWYGWVCGILCDLGSRSVFYIFQRPGMESDNLHFIS